MAEAGPPGAGTPDAPRGISVMAAVDRLRQAVAARSPGPTSTARRPGGEGSGPATGNGARHRELTLPGEVASTPAARRWVADQLAGLAADVVEAAALLVSELVTNAVLYVGTDIVVAVHFGDDRVRIDVADASPVMPLPRDYGVYATTGRGLALLDVMAPTWGVHQTETGKVVWFELPVDLPAAAGAPGTNGGHETDAGFPTVAPPQGRRDDDELSEMREVALFDIPVAGLDMAAQHYEAL
ncbi:MAG TPA: ATP-binding protein, partial [Acidimicrobiales bacterium]|nr:ATP-binding protein [Acidimicrobiales bacterium]